MSTFLRGWPLVSRPLPRIPACSQLWECGCSPQGCPCRMQLSRPQTSQSPSMSDEAFHDDTRERYFSSLFSRFLSCHLPLSSLFLTPFFPILVLFLSFPSKPFTFDYVLLLVRIKHKPLIWPPFLLFPLPETSLPGLMPTLYHFLGRNLTPKLIFSERTYWKPHFLGKIFLYHHSPESKLSPSFLSPLKHSIF